MNTSRLLRVNNFTRKIYSTLCNGISECNDNEDEKNCEIKFGQLFFIAIFIGYTLIQIMAFLTMIIEKRKFKIDSIRRLTIKDLDYQELHDYFQRWHGTKRFAGKIAQFQSSKKRKSMNELLCRLEIIFHSMDKAETLCCMKVNK